VGVGSIRFYVLINYIVGSFYVYFGDFGSEPSPRSTKSSAPLIAGPTSARSSMTELRLELQLDRLRAPPCTDPSKSVTLPLIVR
jgi:hypothetical protein